MHVSLKRVAQQLLLESQDTKKLVQRGLYSNGEIGRAKVVLPSVPSGHAHVYLSKNRTQSANVREALEEHLSGISIVVGGGQASMVKCSTMGIFACHGVFTNFEFCDEILEAIAVGCKPIVLHHGVVFASVIGEAVCINNLHVKFTLLS